MIHESIIQELTCHSKVPRKDGGFKKHFNIWTVPNVTAEQIDAIVQPNSLIVYYNLASWEILTRSGVEFRPDDPQWYETYFVGKIVERKHLGRYKALSEEQRRALIKAMDMHGTPYAVRTRMGDFYPLLDNPSVHVIDPDSWVELPSPSVNQTTENIQKSSPVRGAFKVVKGGKKDEPKAEP